MIRYVSSLGFIAAGLTLSQAAEWTPNTPWVLLVALVLILTSSYCLNHHDEQLIEATLDRLEDDDETTEDATR